jgi:hypothetical protein
MLELKEVLQTCLHFVFSTVEIIVETRALEMKLDNFLFSLC